MYTFNPIASIPVTHEGFVIICCFAIVAVLLVMCNEGFTSMILAMIPAALVVLTAYCVSYVWTDQTPKTFVNQQVTGELVEFVAEGYAVDERHGKSTYRVDKHNSYVVYKVEGQRVLLPAAIGQTYPEKAVLYKN